MAESHGNQRSRGTLARPPRCLIRVEGCAVCSSDVSLIAKPWPKQPPYASFIPGHEYMGAVAAVGETVDEFQV